MKPARGLDLAYERSGEGRPFLWGHGLLASRSQEDSSGPFRWPQIELPGLQLVRWDARGHGRSPAARGSGECRWPALARDALALADHLDIDVFTIGGASMGAATALWVAVTSPHRVDRLVLALPPTAWGNRGRSSALYRAGSLVTGIVPLDAARRRSPVLKGASESDLPDPEVLATITVPALILGWRGDPIHPVSTAERLAELLPAADVHVTGRPLDTTGWLTRLVDFLAY